MKFGVKATEKTFVYPLIGYGMYAVLSKTNQNITIRKEDTGQVIKVYEAGKQIDQQYFNDITFDMFVNDIKDMYLQLICEN